MQKINMCALHWTSSLCPSPCFALKPHIVVFKCIGCTMHHHQQSGFAQSSHKAEALGLDWIWTGYYWVKPGVTLKVQPPFSYQDIRNVYT